MVQENPYAPPEADLDELVPRVGIEDRELARRLTRLVASIVDGFFAGVITLPILYFLGWFDNIGPDGTPPPSLVVIGAIVGFLVFLLLQGYLLKTRGQTIGKKLTKIRIANLDGSLPDFGPLVFKRYFLIHAGTNVPVVGPYFALVNVLFIFRSDRRCLHDLIAGTKVVVTER